MTTTLIFEGTVPERDEQSEFRAWFDGGAEPHQRPSGCSWHAEDSGAALVVEINDDGEDSGAFVRVQGWNDSFTDMVDKRSAEDMRRIHPEAGALIGRRVRITVEVLDDPVSEA